ncbi:putative integral membrane protein [Acanthocheilonema viteae]
MGIIRNGCCAIKSFISAVIEWRSAATAPYFMFINSAFWWSVFYLDKGTQLRLLVSFAAGIFSWDILLSSTYDRSILFHILTWPIRSVLRTISVVMALCSAQFLYRIEFEKACWTAYSAVVLLMINPVWLHHQIPQKINECLYTACTTTKYVVQITIISPVYSFYKILDYIIRFRWLIAILEKVKKELLRMKAAVRSAYVATVTKLYAGMNAMLDATNSILFNIENFISHIVYELKMAVRNGIVYAVTAIRNGIIYMITSTKNGIVFIITLLRNGLYSGSLAVKNGIIDGILQLKNCLIMGFNRSKDAFDHAVIITKNYIRYALTTVQNSILNFFSAVAKWIQMEIIKPIRNAFRAVIQFLQYWLCAHWWPNLKSWLIHRLQLFFNYFCFGIVYVFCGYWINPFVSFLLRHFKRLCAYFQQCVVNPVKIRIKHQIDKALIYLKQMLHNLAIEVCTHLYCILLQPIIDILYKKYKICEDYLLIYCLGPVCQVFVDHIPDKSPFCDDTDTELADLLPPGFANGEESDNDETSDKPSLPSRSHSPLTEDERDFVRGLKFPNLDTSDSSEAEFALKPKSKSQKVLRKKSKAHPKDPAPSACNDELISKEQKVGKNKQRSSSTSSHSESVISSSAQNASDDAELQNLDALDFESDDRSQTEFLENTVEIQKLKDSRDRRSKNRKQNTNQEEVEEIEVCGTEQINVNSVAFVDSLDGSFEVLDK